MKKIVKLKNEFGDEHIKTHVSEVDIEADLGKCLYCSLEIDCQNSQDFKCTENYIYRVQED